MPALFTHLSPEELVGVSDQGAILKELQEAVKLSEQQSEVRCDTLTALSVTESLSGDVLQWHPYTFTQLTHFFSPTSGDIHTVMYMYAVHVHVYTCTREVFGISFIHLLVQFLSVFVGGCREFPCW